MSATTQVSEVTVADLKPTCGLYQSSRTIWDTLIGDDVVSPLVEAISSDDTSTLQKLLSQPQYANIATEKVHCIYGEDEKRQYDGHIRRVEAVPLLILERLIIIAAVLGRPAAISLLLDFAVQHDVEPASVINRWAVDRTIKNGHAAVIKAMAKYYPDVITFWLGFGTLPLDLAVDWRRVEVVAVLLQLGADPSPPDSSHKRAFSLGCSLLSRAAKAKNPHITDLLLDHGMPVAGSGALQMAALLGRLNTMRLLIQHGSDVNERLPQETLPVADKDLHASWTPMHFAASQGQLDAMRLLEEHGGLSNVEDINGKTPTQLLEEHKP